jgi:polysaccharide deacetylase 2 family uncharacterized protein YibQ
VSAANVPDAFRDAIARAEDADLDADHAPLPGAMIAEANLKADAKNRKKLVAGERLQNLAIATSLSPLGRLSQRTKDLLARLGVGAKITEIWQKTGLHRLPWAWILYGLPIAAMGLIVFVASTGFFLLLMAEKPAAYTQGPLFQDVEIVLRASTDNMSIATTATGAPVTQKIPEPTKPVIQIPSPDDNQVSLAPDAKVRMISVNPALIEQTEKGYLPKIAEDGTQPWQIYRRPFPSRVEGPKIAIIMTELGLSPARTAAVIDTMPGVVSLAFLPYVANIQKMIDKARDKGHEILLNLPMEPLGYPRDDPGPDILLDQGKQPDNLDNLQQSLGASNAYIGVISFMGSAITANPVTMEPILRELAQRGLIFVDNGSSARSATDEIATQAGIVSLKVDRMIDSIPQRQLIDDQLASLEKLAQRNGRAIGIIQPLPVSIERVAAWLPGLSSRGITIAPVSALIRAPNNSQNSQKP